jgi:hypothetical protein
MLLRLYTVRLVKKAMLRETEENVEGLEAVEMVY